MDKVCRMSFIGVFFASLFFPCHAFSETVFFSGVQGNLNFPAYEKSEIKSGFGGGFLLEGGIDLDSFQAGLVVGYDGFSSGKKIKKLSEAKVSVSVGYSFDERSFSFMPRFFSLRASVLLGLDLYSAKSYKNDYDYRIGRLSSSSGICGNFAFVLAGEFPKLIYIKNMNLVPYISLSEQIRPEREGGLLTFSLSVGTRLYFRNL